MSKQAAQARIAELEAIIEDLVECCEIDTQNETIESVETEGLYSVVVRAERALIDQPDESWREIGDETDED